MATNVTQIPLITNIDDINSIVKFCSKAQIPLINNNNPAINNKACVLNQGI